MNIGAQLLHVRKSLIGLERQSGSLPLALPRVVDVDVGPAMVGEAGRDEHAGRAQDLLLVDGLGPAVPAVPAHRRREGDAVSADNLELLFRLAPGVAGAQYHGMLAGGLEHTGDLASGRIQHQAGRQAVDRILHRAFAGSRDRVHERCARGDSENTRPIDPRGGGRRRGEDLTRGFRRPRRVAVQGEASEEDNAKPPPVEDLHLG